LGRRSSIFNDIAKLPWQVGVVLAILCYPAAILAKAYFSSIPVLVGFGFAVSLVWPIFCLLFLLAAVTSFVSDRNKTALFKQNKTIEKVRSLNWQQFEQFVGRYFKDQGYFVVETPTGPDGGVDLVLRKDGEKTYVQCKHWKTYKVSVDKVRELLGSMVAGRADRGVLVTTGQITSSARQFGKQHGIRLIDGKELEHLVRVTPDEKLPKSMPDESQVVCPVCNSAMIKRIAKRGPNPGGRFWGCSKFPACKGVRQI
jgi:restriction system protein